MLKITLRINVGSLFSTQLKFQVKTLPCVLFHHFLISVISFIFQPSDQNTKDFIATLSEVALNKGYFQEQMALRDEAMSLRDETITSMREEIDMLKVSNDSVANIMSGKFYRQK